MRHTHPRHLAQWLFATLPMTACALEQAPDDASFRLAQPHCPISEEITSGGTGIDSCGDSDGSSSDSSSGTDDGSDTTLSWPGSSDDGDATGTTHTDAGGTGDSGGATEGGESGAGESGDDGGSGTEGGTDAGGETDAGGSDDGGGTAGTDNGAGTGDDGDGSGGSDGGDDAGTDDGAGGSDGSGGSDESGGSEGAGSSDDDGGADDGGVDDGGADDGGSGTGGGGGPATKDFRIDVMSKSFIGPLAWGGLGAFPGPFWDAIGYAQFRVLAQMTDTSYSESPATGFQNTGDYRLWSDLFVTGKCEVGTGRIRITGLTYPVGNPANNGWEPDIYQAGGQELGPVYGAMNPHAWFVDTDDDGTGFTKITYSYVISGHPNEALEGLFVAAAGRASPDIWHKLTVELFCTDDGDLRIRWQSWGSGFPSLRTWIYSNGTTQLNVVKTVLQGPFSALWSLAPIPQP